MVDKRYAGAIMLLGRNTMDIRQRRQAHLRTLRRVDPLQFSLALRHWLRNPAAAEPPRIIAALPVDSAGAIRLRIDKEIAVFWAFRFQRFFKGGHLLALPYVSAHGKAIAFTEETCRRFTVRIHDPSTGMFWHPASRDSEKTRVFAVCFGEDRRVRIGGLTIHFTSRWKPHHPVQLWLRDNEVTHVRSTNSSPFNAHIKVAVRDQKVTDVLIGKGLPTRVLAGVSGMLELPLQRDSCTGLYYVNRGKKRWHLSRSDARRLGIGSGTTLKITLENGWPVCFENSAGTSVRYRIVRDAEGNIIASSRSRIKNVTEFPAISTVEHVKISRRFGRPDAFVEIQDAVFCIPRTCVNERLAQNAVGVLMHGRTLIYLSRELKLKPVERHLVLKLNHLAKTAWASTREKYAAMDRLLRWCHHQWRKEKLSAVGLIFLLKGIKREYPQIWQTENAEKRLPHMIAAHVIRHKVASFLAEIKYGI